MIAFLQLLEQELGSRKCRIRGEESCRKVDKFVEIKFPGPSSQANQFVQARFSYLKDADVVTEGDQKIRTSKRAQSDGFLGSTFVSKRINSPQCSSQYGTKSKAQGVQLTCEV